MDQQLGETLTDPYLARLQGGDEAVLGELAARFQRPFVAAFTRAQGPFLPAADLEECFYESLADLWLQRERLDPARGSARGYFFGIMRNAVRQRLTQESRERDSRQQAWHDGQIPVATSEALAGAPPEPSDRQRRVRGSLEELGEPYRTILVLDAWCYPEVAAASTVSQITELPNRQVGTYRARARKKLRQLLEREGLEPTR